MKQDEAADAAVKLRDDIARELKRTNGKETKRTKALTDESARLLSDAMRAGFGIAVLDAMRTRPLPADVMPEAAE